MLPLSLRWMPLFDSRDVGKGRSNTKRSVSAGTCRCVVVRAFGIEGQQPPNRLCQWNSNQEDTSDTYRQIFGSFLMQIFVWNIRAKTPLWRTRKRWEKQQLLLCFRPLWFGRNLAWMWMLGRHCG